MHVRDARGRLLGSEGQGCVGQMRWVGGGLRFKSRLQWGKKNKCLDSALTRSARRRERPIMEAGARGIGSRRLLHEEEEYTAALPRFRLAAWRHKDQRVLEILDVASR